MRVQATLSRFSIRSRRTSVTRTHGLPLVLFFAVLLLWGEGGCEQGNAIATTRAGNPLQALVDATSEGEILQLEQGTFLAGDVVVAKNLTLRGSLEVPPAISATGSDSDSFTDALMTGEYPASVVGTLTITRGAHVTLEHVFVVGAPGSGVVVDAGEAILRSCLIAGNGGWGAETHEAARLECIDSAFWSNKAGGVRVGSEGSARLENCLLLKNSGSQLVAYGDLDIKGCAVRGPEVSDATAGYCKCYPKEFVPCVQAAGQVVWDETSPFARENGVVAIGPVRLNLERNLMTGLGGYSLISLRSEEDLSEARMPPLAVLTGFGNTIIAESIDDAIRPWIAVRDLPEGFLVSEYAVNFTHSWRYEDKNYEVSLVLQVPDRYLQDDRTANWGWRVGDWESRKPLFPVFSQLLDMAPGDSWHVIDTVNFIASFVQSLPCGRAPCDEGLYWPIETLFHHGGVCRDDAVLLASLLQMAGFDVVLIQMESVVPEKPGHVLVGVLGGDMLEGSYYEMEGRRYYLLEATGSAKLGEWPPHLSPRLWGITGVIELKNPVLILEKP